ncbi:hypothetical protein HMPREF0281_01421 [Corynebacterium ammoniagenes DSM 20306]|uniref:Uncharacterized protein n=1 Tax=Corynebacterium ammoniagenes DSM 20306 TaxID=649754 RepID=A0ABN0AEM9_CORAM|nr:hypothetical protein HMPREF0281_01421 [Corynebacterium ammoniagenes DSM 20306]
MRSDSSGFVLTAVQEVPKHINTAPIAGNTRNREFHKVRYLCVVQWAELGFTQTSKRSIKD